MGGESRAAVLLEDLEGLFALPEGIEDRGDGADIEGVGAEPEQVARDPVQLGEDDANGLRPRWSLDAHELLDRQAIAKTIRDRGNVIHAVNVRGELNIGAV